MGWGVGRGDRDNMWSRRWIDYLGRAEGGWGGEAAGACERDRKKKRESARESDREI